LFKKALIIGVKDACKSNRKISKFQALLALNLKLHTNAIYKK